MENPLTSKTSLIVVIIALIGIGYFLFSGTPREDTTVSPVATSTNTSTATSAPTGAAKTGTTPTKKTTTTSTAPKTPSMTADGLSIISYTNKGFSPSVLTIKKGKGVHFINNSDKAMRIFADDQNNSLYSGLSQSKTVGRGGTYDFIFTQAGNWAYHNANNTADRGTIIVTE